MGPTNSTSGLEPASSILKVECAPTVDIGCDQMDDWSSILRKNAMGLLPKWLGRGVVLALVVGVTSGVLAEQGAGGVPEVGQMEREATLSGPDQTAWAQREVEKMQGTSRRIQGLLDQARRERDLIMVTCLNDKLTQINVSIRSFEERATQHDESVRSSNTERRDHHYRIMVILAQRASVLRAEAEACVGETDVMFGRTEVTTEIDPSITDDDTTDIYDDDIVFLRPPSASGYY